MPSMEDLKERAVRLEKEEQEREDKLIQDERERKARMEHEQRERVQVPERKSSLCWRSTCQGIWRQSLCLLPLDAVYGGSGHVYGRMVLFMEAVG
eukprot:260142-Rhodomonas_salina.5